MGILLTVDGDFASRSSLSSMFDALLVPFSCPSRAFLTPSTFGMLQMDFQPPGARVLGDFSREAFSVIRLAADTRGAATSASYRDRRKGSPGSSSYGCHSVLSLLVEVCNVLYLLERCTAMPISYHAIEVSDITFRDSSKLAVNCSRAAYTDTKNFEAG